MTTIVQADPKSSYLAHKRQIDTALQRVLKSGAYILGKEVEKFEEEFAEYLQADYAIGVASGTDALEISLRACGIGKGDQVVTVSHTAVATVAAVERSGAQPIFVDIDPRTYTLCPDSLENRLRTAKHKRIKAVIPVHLYGQPADMSSIIALAKKYRLYVIEDCAQAHGADLNRRKMGTWGNLAAFSFYPTKNLGAVGDGGMVVTNHKQLAQRAKLLRQYGWKTRYVSTISGVNSRLDEIQAAILRVKLKFLEADNAQRRAIAEQYSYHLKHSNLLLPSVVPGTRHVFHQYVIRHPRRDLIKTGLLKKGIQTAVHYPLPIHQQPAYRHLTDVMPLKNTELVCQEILSLPIYPHFPLGHLKYTINALNSILSQLHV